MVESRPPATTTANAGPSAPRPTPARSWAELIETLHGGLAVIDHECRFAFVSDRFASLTAIGDARDARCLLGADASDDPAMLFRRIGRGETIELERRLTDETGETRWVRITVVPCVELGHGLMAVAFAHDITASTRALFRLRDSAQRLTLIEDEERRRVSRELHDGPIQLMAALVLRLGLLEDSDETRALRHLASTVMAQLREAIAEFADHQRSVTVGSRLQRWIAPFLEDSLITFEIEDHCSKPPGPGVTHAAFFFLYQVVRAAKQVGHERDLRVVLTEERGGHRIEITLTASSHRAMQVGQVAAQYRAFIDYARMLRATLTDTLGDDGVRVMSFWLPPDVKARSGAVTGRPTALDERTDSTDRERADNDLARLPPLGDDTWEKIVRNSPERSIEFDRDGRFTFVNTANREVFGSGAEELTGRTFADEFGTVALERIAPAMDRLTAGHAISVEWQRESWLGDQRLILLTASPRFDERGEWAGLFAIVEDLSDLEHRERLHKSTLDDFGRARRLTTLALVERIVEPVVATENLVAMIRVLTQSHPVPDAIEDICEALMDVVSRIRRTVGVITLPDLSEPLGRAVRNSLGPLLVGVTLRFVDVDATAPTAESAETFFRIAREAVINAVTHGAADVITMTLSDAAHGLRLTIHDNGVGIDPASLAATSGHLGTQAMIERARERSGRCDIEPAPEGGTLVTVWLPHPAGPHGSPAPATTIST
jgi:PAS domain S-box-containing protein